MHNFTIISPQEFCFLVDKKIFSDEVLSKALYWLSSDFIISRKTISDFKEKITLHTIKSDNIINSESLQKQISQHLSDYKLREIIQKETKDIRNILYIKAFANYNGEEDIDISEE
jgi:His-Xaa-Ser system protein HxsD